MNLHEKRRRRIEIMIDTRMIGFLKPTPVNGSMTARRKRDSLEFLLPRPQSNNPRRESSTDKAS